MPIFSEPEGFYSGDPQVGQWEVGTPGKGVVWNDGQQYQVAVWPVDEVGSPHHVEFMQEDQGIFPPDAKTFYVNAMGQGSAAWSDILGPLSGAEITAIENEGITLEQPNNEYNPADPSTWDFVTEGWTAKTATRVQMVGTGEYADGAVHHGGRPVVYDTATDALYVGSPGGYHVELEEKARVNRDVAMTSGDGRVLEARVSNDGKTLFWYSGQGVIPENHEEIAALLGLQSAMPGSDKDDKWLNDYGKFIQRDQPAVDTLENWTAKKEADDPPAPPGGRESDSENETAVPPPKPVQSYYRGLSAFEPSSLDLTNLNMDDMSPATGYTKGLVFADPETGVLTGVEEWNTARGKAPLHPTKGTPIEHHFQHPRYQDPDHIGEYTVRSDGVSVYAPPEYKPSVNELLRDRGHPVDMPEGDEMGGWVAKVANSFEQMQWDEMESYNKAEVDPDLYDEEKLEKLRRDFPEPDHPQFEHRFLIDKDDQLHTWPAENSYDYSGGDYEWGDDDYEYFNHPNAGMVHHQYMTDHQINPQTIKDAGHWDVEEERWKTYIGNPQANAESLESIRNFYDGWTAAVNPDIGAALFKLKNGEFIKDRDINEHAAIMIRRGITPEMVEQYGHIDDKGEELWYEDAAMSVQHALEDGSWDEFASGWTAKTAKTAMVTHREPGEPEVGKYDGWVDAGGFTAKLAWSGEFDTPEFNVPEGTAPPEEGRYGKWFKTKDGQIWAWRTEPYYIEGVEYADDGKPWHVDIAKQLNAPTIDDYGAIYPSGEWEVADSSREFGTDDWDNTEGWTAKTAKETLPQQQRRWDKLLNEHNLPGIDAELLPNGWSVMNHSGADTNSINAVGRMMNNCWQGTDVGGLGWHTEAGWTYHSLHDEHGIPRAAWYVENNPHNNLPGSLRQPLGDRNKPVSPEHRQMIEHWAEQKGVGSQGTTWGAHPDNFRAQMGEPIALSHYVGKPTSTTNSQGGWVSKLTSWFIDKPAQTLTSTSANTTELDISSAGQRDWLDVPGIEPWQPGTWGRLIITPDGSEFRFPAEYTHYDAEQRLGLLDTPSWANTGYGKGGYVTPEGEHRPWDFMEEQKLVQWQKEQEDAQNIADGWTAKTAADETPDDCAPWEPGKMGRYVTMADGRTISWSIDDTDYDKNVMYPPTHGDWAQAKDIMEHEVQDAGYIRPDGERYTTSFELGFGEGENMGWSVPTQGWTAKLAIDSVPVGQVCPNCRSDRVTEDEPDGDMMKCHTCGQRFTNPDSHLGKTSTEKSLLKYRGEWHATQGEMESHVDILDRLDIDAEDVEEWAWEIDGKHVPLHKSEVDVPWNQGWTARTSTEPYRLSAKQTERLKEIEAAAQLPVGDKMVIRLQDGSELFEGPEDYGHVDIAQRHGLSTEQLQGAQYGFASGDERNWYEQHPMSIPDAWDFAAASRTATLEIREEPLEQVQGDGEEYGGYGGEAIKLVAYENNVPVGSVEVDVTDKPHVRWIEVPEEHRREGIATQLMDEVRNRWGDDYGTGGYTDDGEKFFRAGRAAATRTEHETNPMVPDSMDTWEDEGGSVMEWATPGEDQARIIDEASERANKVDIPAESTQIPASEDADIPATLPSPSNPPREAGAPSLSLPAYLARLSDPAPRVGQHRALGASTGALRGMHSGTSLGTEERIGAQPRTVRPLRNSLFVWEGESPSTILASIRQGALPALPDDHAPWTPGVDGSILLTPDGRAVTWARTRGEEDYHHGEMGDHLWKQDETFTDYGDGDIYPDGQMRWYNLPEGRGPEFLNETLPGHVHTNKYEVVFDPEGWTASSNIPASNPEGVQASLQSARIKLPPDTYRWKPGLPGRYFIHNGVEHVWRGVDYNPKDPDWAGDPGHAEYAEAMGIDDREITESGYVSPEGVREPHGKDWALGEWAAKLASIIEVNTVTDPHHVGRRPVIEYEGHTYVGTEGSSHASLIQRMDVPGQSPYSPFKGGRTGVIENGKLHWYGAPETEATEWTAAATPMVGGWIERDHPGAPGWGFGPSEPGVDDGVHPLARVPMRFGYDDIPIVHTGPPGETHGVLPRSDTGFNYDAGYWPDKNHIEMYSRPTGDIKDMIEEYAAARGATLNYTDWHEEREPAHYEGWTAKTASPDFTSWEVPPGQEPWEQGMWGRYLFNSETGEQYAWWVGENDAWADEWAEGNQGLENRELGDPNAYHHEVLEAVGADDDYTNWTGGYINPDGSMGMAADAVPAAAEVDLNEWSAKTAAVIVPEGYPQPQGQITRFVIDSEGTEYQWDGHGPVHEEFIYETNYIELPRYVESAGYLYPDGRREYDDEFKVPDVEGWTSKTASKTAGQLNENFMEAPEGTNPWQPGEYGKAILWPDGRVEAWAFQGWDERMDYYDRDTHDPQNPNKHHIDLDLSGNGIHLALMPDGTAGRVAGGMTWREDQDQEQEWDPDPEYGEEEEFTAEQIQQLAVYGLKPRSMAEYDPYSEDTWGVLNDWTSAVQVTPTIPMDDVVVDRLLKDNTRAYLLLHDGTEVVGEDGEHHATMVRKRKIDPATIHSQGYIDQDGARHPYNDVTNDMRKDLWQEKWTASATQTLDWQEGEMGKGFIYVGPRGKGSLAAGKDTPAEVWTWNLDPMDTEQGPGTDGFPSHGDMAAYDSYVSPFYIKPDGQVAFYTYEVTAKHPQARELVEAVPGLHVAEQPAQDVALRGWADGWEAKTAALPPQVLEYDYDPWDRDFETPVGSMANGAVTGYEGRRPIIYDPGANVIHVGPNQEAHASLFDAAAARGHDVTAEDYEEFPQGWLGYNSESEYGYDHEEEMNNLGTVHEYGWYQAYGHPGEHVDQALRSHFNAKPVFKDQNEGEAEGWTAKLGWSGDFHRDAPGPTVIHPSMRPGDTVDTQQCSRCRGALLPPTQHGAKWIQKCSNCGRSQMVPFTHPGLISPVTSVRPSDKVGNPQQRRGMLTEKFGEQYAGPGIEVHDYGDPDQIPEAVANDMSPNEENRQKWMTRRPFIYHDNKVYLGGYGWEHEQLVNNVAEGAEADDIWANGHHGHFGWGDNPKEVGFQSRMLKPAWRAEVAKALGGELNDPEAAAAMAPDEGWTSKVAFTEPEVIVWPEEQLLDNGAQPLDYKREQTPDGVGYTKRKPLLYDRTRHQLHEGPANYSHSDVSRTIRSEDPTAEGPYSYGWVGHNPEAFKSENSEYSWYDDIDDNLRSWIAALYGVKDHQSMGEWRANFGESLPPTSNWEPGNYGKWIVTPEGQVHTWSTKRKEGVTQWGTPYEEDDGMPAHADYAAQQGWEDFGTSSNYRCGWIDPQGYTTASYYSTFEDDFEKVDPTEALDAVVNSHDQLEYDPGEHQRELQMDMGEGWTASRSTITSNGDGVVAVESNPVTPEPSESVSAASWQVEETAEPLFFQSSIPNHRWSWAELPPKTATSLDWTPGSDGKGAVMKNGDVYTWNTNGSIDDGVHADVLTHTYKVSYGDAWFCFYIDEYGTVQSMEGEADPEAMEILEDLNFDLEYVEPSTMDLGGFTA